MGDRNPPAAAAGGGRRHRTGPSAPGQQFPPLRSAEPELATREQRAELTLTAEEEIPQLEWIADLAAQHDAFAGKLAERQSLMIPPKTPTTRTSARPSLLDRTGQRRYPPADQTTDPAITTDLGTRRRTRPGHESRRMTDPQGIVETKRR